MNGLCVSFNGWAMKKKGPVLVSMFNPMGTVISVILSVLTLGESISIGRYTYIYKNGVLLKSFYRLNH